MTQIWPFPCEHCPSMQGDDPEARQIRRSYRRGEIPVGDAVFLCGWRQTKLCYGVCLKARVTEETLAKAGFDLEERVRPLEIGIPVFAKRRSGM